LLPDFSGKNEVWRVSKKETEKKSEPVEEVKAEESKE